MSPQTDIYSQTSYAHSYMQQYSPDDQDPFAVYGAQQQHQPRQQPQQPHPQQQQLTYQPQQQLDPWAAMLAPPSFPTQQQQHAPMPSHMQATPPPAPAPQAKQQLTPPPTMYVGGTMGDVSPLGDVSVLAAAFGNQGVAVPPAQPLRPQPQPASAAIVAANPFDFDAMGSSMPAPPEGKPPTPPPTPPRDDVHQQEQQQQQVQQQATAFVATPAANHFGYSWASPTPQYNASPPMSPVPQAQAYGAPMGVTAQQQQQYATSPNQQQQHQQQTAAQYPAYSFSPQQGHDDPFGYAFSPFASPVVSPGSNNGGAMMMITATADNDDPFGRPPYMPGTSDCQAMVPSLAVNEDPFGVMFGGGGSNGSRNNSTALVSAPASDDPFGMGVLGGSSSSSALVPSTSTPNNAYDDPFGGMFGSSTIPVAVAVAAPRSSVASSAGNGYAAASSSPPSSSRPPIDPRLEHVPEEKPIALDTNGLPSDGEYYEARINARSLGTMFYTARNLEDTLFLRVPNNVVEALGSRPVVAYVAENSAAHHAGVNLGHVILSVNGESVANPEYCAGMIRNSPRPIVLRCYAPPELELTVTEGLHKVAYHNKDLEAPVSLSDWKEKFVVVGGIVTKPYMMNMFYKKADYDTAVKEAHAGQKISVKVKQFDLRGARVVLKGMDGVPNRIVYPSQRKPWYFIVVVPNKGYPVKISSESLDALEPIYAGIRRFVNKDSENRYSARMQESFDTLRSRKH